MAEAANWTRGRATIKKAQHEFSISDKELLRAGERTPPLHRAQPLPRSHLSRHTSERASSPSNYELKKFSGLINFTSAHRRLAFFINRQAEAAPTCPPCALITMKNAAPEIFQAVRKLQQTRRRAECEHKHFPPQRIFQLFSAFSLSWYCVAETLNYF
jgi:hypothetical protein